MNQDSVSEQKSDRDDDDIEIYRGVSRQMLNIQTPDRNIAEKSSCPMGIEVDPSENFAGPPGYIPPTQREPLNSVEDETNLPPAGELLYKILHRIEWIWISPMAELTNRRRLTADIKTLCEKHGYSPQKLVSSPIQTAQKRGDFPAES